MQAYSKRITVLGILAVIDMLYYILYILYICIYVTLECHLLERKLGYLSSTEDGMSYIRSSQTFSSTHRS